MDPLLNRTCKGVIRGNLLEFEGTIRNNKGIWQPPQTDTKQVGSTGPAEDTGPRQGPIGRVLGMHPTPLSLGSLKPLQRG